MKLRLHCGFLLSFILLSLQWQAYASFPTGSKSASLSATHNVVILSSGKEVINYLSKISEAHLYGNDESRNPLMGNDGTGVKRDLPDVIGENLSKVPLNRS